MHFKGFVIPYFINRFQPVISENSKVLWYLKVLFARNITIVCLGRGAVSEVPYFARLKVSTWQSSSNSRFYIYTTQVLMECF